MNYKNREINIDLMKTILVIGMILSHSFAILNEKLTVSYSIGNYINLITFSSFLFIYGYNSYNHAICKKISINKALKSVMKLLIAFWINGFLFNYLYSNIYDINDYIKTFFLLKLPPYSEFIVPYILIILLTLLFHKQFKKICSNNKYIIISIIVSFLFCLLPPVNAYVPWLNLFIKTSSISFPLFPYLNLYFIGIYFAKNKPKYNIIILICLLLINVLGIIFGYGSRFPISISYIVCSYVFIYLYYYISLFICNKYKSFNKITILGRHSLLCLIFSDVMLLILFKFHLYLTELIIVLYFLLIIIVCYLLGFIIEKKTRLQK